MLKNLFVLLLAVAIGAGGYYYYTHHHAAGGSVDAAVAGVEGAPAPGEAMPVSVAAALQSTVTEWTEYSGRLRAAEDVQIRPRVGGTIVAVHFTEGDIVHKGDKLFTIDTRPYQAAFDQAAAQVDAAEAALNLAVTERKRAKGLLDEKAISQKEFDERNNASKSAWANLKAAKAARDIAALNLEYATVTAPIDGRVGRPDITVGNTVQAGQDVLTTVQSTSPIYADFDMDEATYLRAMKSVRMEGKAQDMPVFMALADEDDFSRTGKIRSFDNQVSANSGTLRVRAEFDNADGFLTPGLFARIRLGGADPQKVVQINDAAIGTDQDRKFVYVVGEDGGVNYRPVALGAMNGGLRIITNGLQAGEKIVVNGLMRVHPGMKVQPMMVDMTTLKPDNAPAATEGQP